MDHDKSGLMTGQLWRLNQSILLDKDDELWIRRECVWFHFRYAAYFYVCDWLSSAGRITASTEGEDGGWCGWMELKSATEVDISFVCLWNCSIFQHVAVLFILGRWFILNKVPKNRNRCVHTCCNVDSIYAPTLSWSPISLTLVPWVWSC